MGAEAFEPVLDDDEKVLKIYKPDKKRTWLATLIWIILTILVIVPCCIITFIQGGDALPAGIILMIYGVLAVCLPLIFNKLWLNKTVYAATNKRIIIRSGIIGVDFKTLEYKMLGAISINVGLMDKLLGRNTGNISFGGVSSPLTNQSAPNFLFSHVVDPYRTNKEIKSIINEYREM